MPELESVTEEISEVIQSAAEIKEFYEWREYVEKAAKNIEQGKLPTAPPPTTGQAADAVLEKIVDHLQAEADGIKVAPEPRVPAVPSLPSDPDKRRQLLQSYIDMHAEDLQKIENQISYLNKIKSELQAVRDMSLSIGKAMEKLANGPAGFLGGSSRIVFYSWYDFSVVVPNAVSEAINNVEKQTAEVRQTQKIRAAKYQQWDAVARAVASATISQKQYKQMRSRARRAFNTASNNAAVYREQIERGNRTSGLTGGAPPPTDITPTAPIEIPTIPVPDLPPDLDVSPDIEPDLPELPEIEPDITNQPTILAGGDFLSSVMSVSVLGTDQYTDVWSLPHWLRITGATRSAPFIVAPNETIYFLALFPGDETVISVTPEYYDQTLVAREMEQFRGKCGDSPRPLFWKNQTNSPLILHVAASAPFPGGASPKSKPDNPLFFNVERLKKRTTHICTSEFHLFGWGFEPPKPQVIIRPIGGGRVERIGNIGIGKSIGRPHDALLIIARTQQSEVEKSEYVMKPNDNSPFWFPQNCTALAQISANELRLKWPRGQSKVFSGNADATMPKGGRRYTYWKGTFLAESRGIADKIEITSDPNLVYVANYLRAGAGYVYVGGFKESKDSRFLTSIVVGTPQYCQFDEDESQYSSYRL